MPVSVLMWDYSFCGKDSAATSPGPILIMLNSLSMETMTSACKDPVHLSCNLWELRALVRACV